MVKTNGRRFGATPFSAAVVSLCWVLIPVQPAVAPPQQVVKSADDLPRYSYPVSGRLADLLDKPAALAPLVDKLRADTEATLAKYQIEDRATVRELHRLLMYLALLRGDADVVVRIARRKRTRLSASPVLFALAANATSSFATSRHAFPALAPADCGRDLISVKHYRTISIVAVPNRTATSALIIICARLTGGVQTVPELKPPMTFNPTAQAVGLSKSSAQNALILDKGRTHGV